MNISAAMINRSEQRQLGEERVILFYRLYRPSLKEAEEESRQELGADTVGGMLLSDLLSVARPAFFLM